MITPSQLSELEEALAKAAEQSSEFSRGMAEAKSLRQESNTERRTDLYMWPTPEQTLEGRALATIRTLRDQVKLAREEGLEEAAGIAEHHARAGRLGSIHAAIRNHKETRNGQS